VVISVGALAGMTTTLMGALFALPRLVYAMAQDGLLFKCFARVNQRTQLPLVTVGVWGFLSAVVALIFDIEKLVEFMSIGTLMAYSIVSAAVVILRYRPKHKIDTIPLTEINSEQVQERLYVTGSLHPKFIGIEQLIGCHPAGKVPSACVLIYAVSCSVFFSVLQWGNENAAGWSVALLLISSLTAVSALLLITAHQQSTETLLFRVPLVPLIPALSISANIALMVNLNPMTWVRFLVWVTIGLFIYFGYGIRHSKESAGITSFSGLLAKSNSNAEMKTNWGTNDAPADTNST